MFILLCAGQTGEMYRTKLAIARVTPLFRSGAKLLLLCFTSLLLEAADGELADLLTKCPNRVANGRRKTAKAAVAITGQLTALISGGRSIG